MNKVICDVCGTKYPEIAEQCPICGCAKPDNARIAADDAVSNESGAVNNYTHVKGGRFSKSNVRKRNKNAQNSNDNAEEFADKVDSKKKENNTGLVIAIVVLLLAVIAAMLFIFFKYFVPATNKVENNDTTGPVVQSTVATSTDTISTTTEQLNIPCTGVTISTDTIHIDEINNSYPLNFEVSPANTTDIIWYESSDKSVATVSVDGRIVFVSAGETVITVRCGEFEDTCNVIVSDSSATTEVTVPEITEATVAVTTWKLNRKDISFTKKDEAWKLYVGDIAVEDITWSSDDPAIATFVDGVVTAVSSGVTNVHAEYNGEKFTCIIRCRISDDITGDNNTTTNTETTQPSNNQSKYVLCIDGVSVDDRQWGNDVTIGVKKSFQLTLRTVNGDIIAVDWRATKDNICTINGNTIVGKTKGNTEIFVEYSGKTYSCKVTVK